MADEEEMLVCAGNPQMGQQVGAPGLHLVQLDLQPNRAAERGQVLGQRPLAGMGRVGDRVDTVDGDQVGQNLWLTIKNVHANGP